MNALNRNSAIMNETEETTGEGQGRLPFVAVLLNHRLPDVMPPASGKPVGTAAQTQNGRTGRPPPAASSTRTGGTLAASPRVTS